MTSYDVNATDFFRGMIERDGDSSWKIEHRSRGVKTEIGNVLFLRAFVSFIDGDGCCYLCALYRH